MMPSSRDVDHVDYQLVTSLETRKKSCKRELKKQPNPNVCQRYEDTCANVVSRFIFASKLPNWGRPFPFANRKGLGKNQPITYKISLPSINKSECFCRLTWFSPLLVTFKKAGGRVSAGHLSQFVWIIHALVVSSLLLLWLFNWPPHKGRGIRSIPSWPNLFPFSNLAVSFVYEQGAPRVYASRLYLNRSLYPGYAFDGQAIATECVW